ncbi:MAG: hypothetical protein RRY34_02610 [Victivallaceae bacterium]
MSEVQKQLYRIGVRCGESLWDSFNWNYPLVQVCFTTEALQIQIKFFKVIHSYRLSYRYLVAAEQVGVFFRRIHLIHNAPGVPKYLMLWCRRRDFGELLAALQAHIRESCDGKN